MSYRLALLIFALSFLFLVGFSATAGMSGVSVWLAIAFFVLYFMVNIAVTRMRVEMGVPIHDIHNGGRICCYHQRWELDGLVLVI